MTKEPAFPHPLKPSEYGRGMTLRDYFAAKALAICPVSTLSDKSEWCYKMADAMLEARNK